MGTCIQHTCDISGLTQISVRLKTFVLYVSYTLCLISSLLQHWRHFWFWTLVGSSWAHGCPLNSVTLSLWDYFLQISVWQVYTTQVISTKTRESSRGKLRSTAHSAPGPTCVSCFFSSHLRKLLVGGWTQRPSMAYWAHLTLQLISSMFFFCLFVFFWNWHSASPLNYHHLWLKWSEMMVPLIQTHSFGMKASVFFNSHAIAVDSCPSGFFFLSIQLISRHLMDEDSRCPADYQLRQLKAGTGRRLAGVFYQTHLRWIHTASVCCRVRLNLSPFVVKQSFLLSYWDWIESQWKNIWLSLQ